MTALGSSQFSYQRALQALVFLLSSGVQGWFMGGMVAWFMRAGLIITALLRIVRGLITDIADVPAFAALYVIQKVLKPTADAQIVVKGAD